MNEEWIGLPGYGAQAVTGIPAKDFPSPLLEKGKVLNNEEKKTQKLGQKKMGVTNLLFRTV